MKPHDDPVRRHDEPSEPGQLFDSRPVLDFKTVEDRNNGIEFKDDFIRYCVDAFELHMKEKDIHTEEWIDEATLDFQQFLYALVSNVYVQVQFKEYPLVLLLNSAISKPMSTEHLSQVMTLFAEWAGIHRLPERFAVYACVQGIALSKMICACGKPMVDCELHLGAHEKYDRRYPVDITLHKLRED